MSSDVLGVLEVDRRAELVAGINCETEIQRTKGAAQVEAQRLEQSILEFTEKTWLKIRRCHEDIHQCNSLLQPIESMKRELLATTPEGKRISRLETELQELRFKDGCPILLQKRRAQELAMDRSATEPAERVEAERLGREIASIEKQIDEHQGEIDRLWGVLLSADESALMVE